MLHCGHNFINPQIILQPLSDPLQNHGVPLILGPAQNLANQPVFVQNVGMPFGYAQGWQGDMGQPGPGEQYLMDDP